MRIPIIDLKAQYNSMAQQLSSVILEVMESANYIMGKNVTEFENGFSKYLDAKHSIAVGNGTDALVIALKALGVGPGDEVITSPFTFFATAESISAVGAKPVFTDVDPDTFNMDAAGIEEKITTKTKVILPVHIFGQPADMDEIIGLAKKYNLYVMEDACQAIGAEYKGRKVGAIGDAACFSFFPTKNLSCAGDGGMITAGNEKICTIVKALRNHGSGDNGEKAYNFLNHIDEKLENNHGDGVFNPSKYYNYLIGCNSRLDEIQAAILKVKLQYIDNWNNLRRDNAKFYNENIQNKSILKPLEKKDRKHVYHMYVIQAEHRSDLIDYLKHKEIAVGVYYPVPLHLQKAYTHLNYKAGDLPNAEYLTERTLAIPVYPEMTKEQRDYVVECLNNYK